jgi:hypothetical protein
MGGAHHFGGLQLFELNEEHLVDPKSIDMRQQKFADIGILPAP